MTTEHVTLTMLMEFLQADRDPGNREVKEDFADIEGEDFTGL